MPTCILLFRGINVGGRTRLPMEQLVEMLNEIGIPGAVTYIQSGNVAVRCSRQQATSLGRRLKEVMRRRLEFEPAVLVLRIQEVEHAIAANPFREAARDPKTLHLWFLSSEPADPDLDGLDRLKSPAERFSTLR